MFRIYLLSYDLNKVLKKFQNNNVKLKNLRWWVTYLNFNMINTQSENIIKKIVIKKNGIAKYKKFQ